MIRNYNGYEHRICVSRTSYEHHTPRRISYGYDTENYGFDTSRETIEKHLNHRSFSVDFLINI